ncbi:hypothetical protein N9Z27_01160 [Alphaproteobacteria bacterium]|nr:hypothetical protein [Alphaproteobacteria bacterium]
MKKLLFWIVVGILIWGGYKYYTTPRITLPAPNHDPAKVWQDPIQKDLSGIRSLAFNRGKVKLMAEYEITGRVLIKTDYNDGTQARIAPMDLAIGWSKMADPNIYKKISHSQANRFYHPAYLSNKPPISNKQLNLNSANIHMIPASREVKAQLQNLRKEQIVTLKGYLVNYKETYPGGGWWGWKSSLTRTDTGAGACELMYIEHVIAY